ncbi:MAG TPA: hypothetical protein VGR45_17600 [Stellaceae bacterium]|nr:hypothetical protein [Stellaceae bacterium]
MTKPTDSMLNDGDTRSGLDRACALVTELADAVRSAALCAAGEQVRRGARQVGGVAEAVRAAARSLDRSESPTAARYADQTAERIERFSRSLHQQRWSEIIDDVEDVARRRPALFVLGAVTVGFLAGRLLSDPSPQDHAPRARSVTALRPEEAVKAAVASASGNGVLAGRVDDGSAPRERR